MPRRSNAYRASSGPIAALTAAPRIPEVQPALRYEHIDRDDDLVDEELRLLTAGVSVLFDGHRSKLQANSLWDVRGALTEGNVRMQYQVEF